MNSKLVSTLVLALRGWAGTREMEGLTVTDLQHTFPGLTENDAWAVKEICNPSQFNTYEELGRIVKDSKASKSFVECALESLHSSLDGWDPEQQVVIELFLADCVLYSNTALEQ